MLLSSFYPIHVVVNEHYHVKVPLQKNTYRIFDFIKYRSTEFRFFVSSNLIKLKNIGHLIILLKFAVSR